MNDFNACREVTWGRCYYNRHDANIGRIIRDHGEFSVGEVELLKSVTPPGSLFMDIGANIGAITVPMAQHIGAGAVVAFEPQRHVYQLLCANIAANSLSNVFAERCMVGNVDGTGIVPDLDPRASNTPGSLSLVPGSWKSGEACQARRLDGFSSMAGLSTIKIDVEGMEVEVLLGGRELIAQFRPTIYVENDRIERSAELISLLRDYGYKLFWDFPLLSRTGPEVFSFNMICFPVERAVETNLEPVMGVDDTWETAVKRISR